MNENNQYLNQAIEGGNFNHPQIILPAPNTIYSDIQNNIYKNQNQLNQNTQYIPPNINDINPAKENNDRYPSQNNDNYLPFGQNNENNYNYSQNNNLNYINSQNNENNYNYSQNSENIYSQNNGNVYAQNNGNIYSQNNGNIYSQNNQNIYSSLENNLQPISDINNGYNSQINIKSNYAFNVQNSENNCLPSENIYQANANNNLIQSSVPLIPLSNENNNVDYICCKNINVFLDDLDRKQKILLIIFGILIIILAISNILYVSSITSDYSFTLPVEIIFILYGILISISFLRNRFLRITATIFSTILIFAGTLLSIGHIIYLNNIIGNKDGFIIFSAIIIQFRLIFLIVLTISCYSFYFGKNCNISGGGGGHRVHSGHSSFSKKKSSPFHNRSKPHKIGIHKKNKPKSGFSQKKSHSSRPHHSGRGGRRGGRH